MAVQWTSVTVLSLSISSTANPSRSNPAGKAAFLSSARKYCHARAMDHARKATLRFGAPRKALSEKPMAPRWAGKGLDARHCDEAVFEYYGEEQ